MAGGGAIRACRARLQTIVRASDVRLRGDRYWLSVFPRVRAELAGGGVRARQIPDRTLREAAFDALRTKSDVLEGADRVRGLRATVDGQMTSCARSQRSRSPSTTWTPSSSCPIPTRSQTPRASARRCSSRFAPGKATRITTRTTSVRRRWHISKARRYLPDGGRRLPSFGLVAEPLRRSCRASRHIRASTMATRKGPTRPSGNGPIRSRSGSPI